MEIPRTDFDIPEDNAGVRFDRGVEDYDYGDRHDRLGCCRVNFSVFFSRRRQICGDVGARKDVSDV